MLWKLTAFAYTLIPLIKIKNLNSIDDNHLHLGRKIYCLYDLWPINSEAIQLLKSSQKLLSLFGPKPIYAIITIRANDLVSIALRVSRNVDAGWSLMFRRLVCTKIFPLFNPSRKYTSTLTFHTFISYVNRVGWLVSLNNVYLIVESSVAQFGA